MVLAKLWHFNAAGSAKSSLERCGLFFPYGTMAAENIARVQADGAISVARIDRLWGDGSIRRAYLDLYKEFDDGLSSTDIDLDAGDAPEGNGGQANVVLEQFVKAYGAGTAGFYLGGTRIDLQQGATYQWVKDSLSPMCSTMQVFGRHPGGYRWSLTLKCWHPKSVAQLATDVETLRVIDWTFRITWNTRLTTDLRKNLPGLTMKFPTTGNHISINHPDQRVISSSAASGVTTYVLLAASDDGNLWGDQTDGQAYEVSGRWQWVTGTEPDCTGRPIRPLQEDLLKTGAAGLVGQIPRAARDSGDQQDMVTFYEGVIDGRLKISEASSPDKAFIPWQQGRWNLPQGAQSGDHRGWGLTGPGALLWNAPNVLEEMHFANQQEACRPIWFYNDNGTPMSLADSRGTHWWNERPFHTGDMLGKAAELDVNTIHGIVAGPSGQTWSGLDRGHCEDFVLVMFPMLTGDDAAKIHLHERLDRIASTCRIDGMNAFGAALMSDRVCRILTLLARGHELFYAEQTWEKILAERVNQYALAFDVLAAVGPLVPVATYPPQGSTAPGGQVTGHLPDRVAWSPSSDAIVIETLLTIYAETGNPVAITLAARYGANLVLHGFELRDAGPNEWYQIFAACDYNGGQPIATPVTHIPYEPGDQAIPADGTAFALWAYGAVATAWTAAVAYGSVNEAARPAMKIVAVKAAAIMWAIQKAYNSDFDNIYGLLELENSRGPADGGGLAEREANAEWLSQEIPPPPAWFGLRALSDPMSDIAPETRIDLNVGPTANAGPDQLAVVHSSTVNLTGAASTDPEGQPLTYAWAQTSGVIVALTGGTTATPHFTAPVDIGDSVTFRLTVTDSHGATASDSVTVTVGS